MIIFSFMPIPAIERKVVCYGGYYELWYYELWYYELWYYEFIMNYYDNNYNFQILKNNFDSNIWNNLAKILSMRASQTSPK